jgi:hypothetical protein
LAHSLKSSASPRFSPLPTPSWPASASTVPPASKTPR